MKKFLVLYQAPVSAREQLARATPEQAKAGMDAWMAWANKAGKSIVEMGMPLGSGKELQGSTVKEGKTTVTGYSILQCDSVDSVTKLLKDHPHLKMPNFSIELLEFLPLPGM